MTLALIVISLFLLLAWETDRRHKKICEECDKASKRAERIRKP